MSSTHLPLQILVKDQIRSRDDLAFYLLRQLRPDLRKIFPLVTQGDLWRWLGWMITSGASEYVKIRENVSFINLARGQSPIPTLTNAELAIYLSRPDVISAIHLHEVAKIKSWFSTSAVSEYDLSYLTEENEIMRRQVTDRPFGVNIIGYAKGELGIGEDCRMAARSLHENGVPYCVIDFSAGSDVSTGANTQDIYITSSPKYSINIFCLTALETGRFFLSKGEEFFDGFYNIGYWPWELSEWPKPLLPIFSLVDEIWSSSRHTYDAVSAVSNKPVLIMPMSVEVKEISTKTRHDFGLPLKSTLFSFSFDFNSSSNRKNPQAVIKAFLRAFPDPEMHDDVGLVIKTHHSSRNNCDYSKLKAELAGDPRFFYIDGTLSKADVLALYAACDCFVSLHRAEGFGRGIAEAMLLGRHVITTNYSGNLEFCNASNCDLVNAPLISISNEDYEFGDNNVWGEPDVQQAAELMLRFYRNKTTKTFNKSFFSPLEVGSRYKKRLDVIRTALSMPDKL